jgi:hypothetical protein
MIHVLVFENPALLFFAVFCVALFALRKMQSVGVDRLRVIAGWFGGAAVGAYLVVNALNLWRGGLLWHDEANMLAISAAFLHGQPMYHALRAADFYSLFYGPVVFLIYAPFLAFLPDPFAGMRIALFVVSLVEMALLFRLVRTWLSAAESLGLMALATAVLLAYPDELLGFRADAWIVLFVTLAALLAVRGTRRSWGFRAVVLGIALGLAVGLEITVVAVGLVVLAILYRRDGVKAAVLAAGSGVVVCVAPFLVPGISARHYAQWLMLARHQGFLRSTCLENLVVAVVLVLPMVMAWVLGRTSSGRGTHVSSFGRLRTRHGAPGFSCGSGLGYGVLALGCLALLVCVASGSKASAGPWHLWPMVPLVLLGAAYMLRRRDDAGSVRRMVAIVASVAIAGACTSFYFARVDVKVLRPLMASAWKAKERAAKVSLEEIVAAHRGKNLAMGYGSNLNDDRTNLRYVLPLAGKDYFFDENEVVEGIKERKPVPANVVARVLGCEDDWLIPHGEVPFSTLRDGALPETTTRYVFADDLREGFVKTHVMVVAGSYYDLWVCKADTAKG